MNFKDVLDEDLDKVFFNEGEVGEVVTFAGVELTVVKSSESFQKKYKGRAEETGIYTGGLTISIKKSDLPIIIEPGEKITIDETTYDVIDVDDLGNTYRIDIINHRR